MQIKIACYIRDVNQTFWLTPYKESFEACFKGGENYIWFYTIHTP